MNLNDAVIRFDIREKLDAMAKDAIGLNDGDEKQKGPRQG